MKSVLRRAAGCAESVSSFVDFFTPVKGWCDYRYAVSSEGKPPHLLNRIFWVAWFYDADSLVGEPEMTDDCS